MSEIIEMAKNIVCTDVFQTIFKLILITILAGLIGYERENSGKPAGFRTYVLVGISSVLVMICGFDIASSFGSDDPSRMPAQLLSGIGFIGAGTILSNGFKVRGLTTAASLLAITCIGLSVGAGLYLYAVIATAIVYVVLRYSYLFNEKLDHISQINFFVDTKSVEDVIDEIGGIISDHEMQLNKVLVEAKENGMSTIKYSCKINNSTFDKNSFITDVIKIKKVKQISEIKK